MHATLIKNTGIWCKRNSVRNMRSGRVHASYTDFLKDIEDNRVIDVHIQQNQRELHYIKETDGKETKILLPNKNNATDLLIEHNIPFTIDPNPPSYMEIGAVCIEIAIVFALFFSLLRGNSGLNAAGKFTQSNAKNVAPGESQVTFADVAGVEQAKQDLMEVVDFLKSPERYIRLGAKIPKGILLVGPPGTGKTLLARAIAGEAGVEFLSASGSEFIEMFVGVGASRIRSLWQEAKKKAPCIIFIDEIDAIGKARSSGPSSAGNTEQDQTINQLLTAMDGFETNSGVIVIGATNRAELLDDALLRPGRFDRRVFVDLPDLHGRKEILGIHTAKKPMSADCDLGNIATNTVGFSGADLANLANEAAMTAARNHHTEILPKDWDHAFEKVTLGDEKKTVLMTPEKRKLVAYHEAGHALMAILVNEYDVIRKISIIPRGAAGGYTAFEPDENRVDMNLVSYDYLKNQIMVALGGRIAEEIIFGTTKVSTGAVGDLQRVSEIAYTMVASLGFNEEIGPMDVSANAPIDASGEVFSEMRFLISHCYEKAHEMMMEQEFYLHKIAKALMEKETLSGSDVTGLIQGLSCKIKLSKHNINDSDTTDPPAAFMTLSELL